MNLKFRQAPNALIYEGALMASPLQEDVHVQEPVCPLALQ
jgi:hypothetical protein